MGESILQIAQEHLRKVKKSGNENIMAICPFHRGADGSEERNPSFAMNIYSGLWYCHSCHTRGNLFTFLRDIGLPWEFINTYYKHAIEEAATHAPPQPDPLNPVEAVKEPLPEGLLGLFEMCPQLLLDEGYPEELLQKFDVGFDEKHMRITFPLRDIHGRLVGISGRTVVGAAPRYKIYDKEYLDFGLQARETQKRVLLWNAHNVIPQLLTFNPTLTGQLVIIVEGFKAAMRLVQAGVYNVVALLGSRLSFEQHVLLNWLHDCRLLLMLDNNDAGQAGQVDAGKRLIVTHPNVSIVQYNAAQPSDLAIPNVTQAILEAQPFTSWYMQQNSQP